jgi:phosphatidate cytidylyltransferase
VIIPNEPGRGSNAQPASPDIDNFQRRTASALVLAPVAIAIGLLGGWIFAAACAITAVVVLWEWTALVAGGARWRILAPGIAALFVAAALLQQNTALAAGAAIVIGALAAAAVALGLRHEHRGISVSWIAAGVVYAGAIVMSLIPLRLDPDKGAAALLFVFAVVWATDISAYIVGRALRGPLLWPQISPRKTWAGAIGGLAGGIVAGSSVAYASAGTPPLVAAILAVILSIAAQAGDLFESWVKRRFGAKDAGRLIPGHGGVMDRVDGLLVAALAAVLIGVLRYGTAASARGLLVW